MDALKSINLAVRFLLELCVLAAVGYWGFKTSSGWFLKILLGIGAPLLIAVIWGMFGAPKANLQLHGFHVVGAGSGGLWLRRGGAVRNKELFPGLGICGNYGHQPDFDVCVGAVI